MTLAPVGVRPRDGDPVDHRPSGGERTLVGAGLGDAVPADLGRLSWSEEQLTTTVTRFLERAVLDAARSSDPGVHSRSE